MSERVCVRDRERASLLCPVSVQV